MGLVSNEFALARTQRHVQRPLRGTGNPKREWAAGPTPPMRPFRRLYASFDKLHPDLRKRVHELRRKISGQTSTRTQAEVESILVAQSVRNYDPI